MEFENRYIIGIDLGTTNSAVSYVDLRGESEERKIKLFKIPQLTGPGEVTRVPVLPSFLYISGSYDISREAIVIPWKKDSEKVQNFVGVFARDHGARVPARLVSSAKSWLCHSNVDRRARILPWGSGNEVYKISPVQATAAFLEHIKNAWNHVIAAGEDEDLFENQMIIITVPASFDQVARDLTVKAAAMAGLRDVTLLEEPLAAFYSWLIRHETEWNKFVNPNELILVCDVGGGTTDFTLITLREAEGSPRFERISVGDHLILGGDNIDLALARQIEMQFSKRKLSLTADRWKALCHQCREAKESILEGREAVSKITIMGEGSKLIAGTISADLDRKTVEETVIEGFFPIAKPREEKKRIVRSGITEFGLPYEQEPAVTKHLGWFLEQHRQDVKAVLGRENIAPDLILFNGGSLKPTIVQERIRSAIRNWFGVSDMDSPRVLENPTPDLAVALGASYYGLVKIGEGVRVGSGSARAYYMGILTRDKASGEMKTGKAICLVERGLDEGSCIELKDLKFEVLANQPVRFDLYSSSYRSGDQAGDIIEIDQTMTALPPLQTIIQFGKKEVQTQIPVRIEATFTEMGTLTLWCRSQISNHRWQLQFQLRDAIGPSEVYDEKIFEQTVVSGAKERINAAFSQRTASDRLESLVKDINTVVGKSKDRWPLGFIRDLADELIGFSSARKNTPIHESRWLNLTGFCMRPGFGEGFDPQRMKRIWKIYQESQQFPKNVQVRSEWWILWRRVAGGLKSGQQRQFSQDLTTVMIPKKKKKVKISPQEHLEMWMALANMELLYTKEKIKWGCQLLSEISPKTAKPQHFWALSRLGARVLLYGPADRVIDPQEIRKWIETLLDHNWPNPRPVGVALAQIARRTRDRSRDVDMSVIQRILNWMKQDDFFRPHMRYLEEVVPMEKQEESAIFGESLPSGFILHT